MFSSQRGSLKKGALVLGAALVIGGVMPAHAEESMVNISPVVQLVSYKGFFGKYFSMYGWGSASVIDKNGHIISNNHVVDDGTGKLATVFNVCVTKKEKERPTCDYTASLIAREEQMDVSLLQIDPKDIYGNPVNYAAFKTIDIDYAYIPKTQDEAVLIGYPWIGADTITETKGIVSGLAEVNGFQYIKTDATIAGGNSGGAMVNKEGKLIGIPTLSMGGFMDANLGYGLHIKEAQQFIESNITKTAEMRIHTKDFLKYKTTIDQVNKAQHIEDKLLTMNLPVDYELKDYEPNRVMMIGTKSMRDVSVDMMVGLQPLPNVKDEKELFYILERMGNYAESDSLKLVKKNIGGIEFSTQVSKYDVTDGKASYDRFYFAKLSPKLLLTVEVRGPFYEEKNLDKMQVVVESLFNQMMFTKTSLLDLENQFTFDITAPEVKISGSGTIVRDEMRGIATNYFGNLHEYMVVSLDPQSLYSGSKSTPEEVFAAETLQVNDESKSMISYMGRKGYVVCENSPSYGYYGYMSMDERGHTLPEQGSCTIKILEGLQDNDGQPYIMNVTMVANKIHMKEDLEKTYAFMKKNITLSSFADGKTDLIVVFNQLPELLFKDLGDQADGYKNALKYFVKYNLIANKASFDPYYPLKWKDLLPIYLKATYGVDLMKDAKGCEAGDKACIILKAESMLAGKKVQWKNILIDQMGIDLEAYVAKDKYQYGQFKNILELRLAGVNLSSFSEEEISRFMDFRQEKIFESENKKYEDFLNAIHGKRSITINEVVNNYGFMTFRALKSVFFVKDKGLFFRDVRDTKPYAMQHDLNKSEVSMWYAYLDKDILDRRQANMETLKSCSGKQATTTCLATYIKTDAELSQEEYNLYYHSFEVVTKADLIDDLMPNTDFGLFDSKLAAKKNMETSMGMDK